MAEYIRHNRDGFEIHLLRTPEVEIEVVPALGAKITSLRSRRTGREWMWSPPGARLFQNEVQDPFSASTLIGADECFPTVGACKWKDRDLPDHGEVWSQSWEIDTTKDGIDLRLECPISPFVIRRRTRLEKNQIFISYEVENRGTGEESYLWAFHPLIKIEPDDRIEVPASLIRADLAIECPLAGWERQWEWPGPLPEVHLDSLDFGPYAHAAVKVFTESLSEGRAVLCNDRTGESLELAFDLREIDTLGIWINRGGWNGFHHVALEPACGAPDRLDQAVGQNGRSRRLASGATARWRFSITLC